MKRYLLICSSLLVCCVLRAQPDTLFYIEEDTTPALPPVRFHLQTLGAYWLDGRVQFFDGYNREILYADASTGLPLYSDWHLFSPNSLLPTYFQVGMQAGFTDSIRGLRLRMGVMYAHRTDTMSYSGGYLTTDTALGRLASESGGFGGVSITMMKQTRTLFKFLRLYGGAEFEAGLSPQSKIRSTEFAYDIGDEKLLAYNVFLARGRPRLNVFLNAVVGFETVFGKHYGFVAEVRSGLGSQLVVKEKAYGMARTAYMVGLQYYLWDHQRRPLPTRLHEVEPEIEPEIIAPGQ